MLPGEDVEEFAAFRQRMLDSLAPSGENELALAERVIDASWRLKRLPAAEANLLAVAVCREQADLAHQQAEDLVDPPYPRNMKQARKPGEVRDALLREEEARAEANRPEYALGRAFLYDAQGAAGLSLLSRYEAAIEGALYRSLRKLRMARSERLETERDGGGTATPIQPQKEKLRNDLTDGLIALEPAA